MPEQDEQFMRRALELAEQAALADEVPIGAVLVQDGRIIAEGRNQPIAHHDATAHAEIVAIRNAGVVLENYRLPNSTLYVTLEPCCMCMGAILHARISNVVFAAFDLKTGAAGSVINIAEHEQLNHHTTIKGGLLESESIRLLQHFFRKRR